TRQAPSVETTGQQQKQAAANRAQREQSVVELEAQAEKLKQRLELTPQAKRDERAAIEAKLAEVERNLEEHRQALEASQRLKQLLEEYEKTHPTDEAKLKELLAQAKLKTPAELEEGRQTIERLAAEQAASQGDRKPRVLSH